MSSIENESQRPRPIAELAIGESSAVIEVDRASPERLRLLEMGLTPGTELELIRVAPTGDPMEFLVRGYRLALSRREAMWVYCK